MSTSSYEVPRVWFRVRFWPELFVLLSNSALCLCFVVLLARLLPFAEVAIAGKVGSLPWAERLQWQLLFAARVNAWLEMQYEGKVWIYPPDSFVYPDLFMVLVWVCWVCMNSHNVFQVASVKDPLVKMSASCCLVLTYLMLIAGSLWILSNSQ